MRDNTDVSNQVEWILNWFSAHRDGYSWVKVIPRFMAYNGEAKQRKVLVIELESKLEQPHFRLRPFLTTKIEKDDFTWKYYFHPNPELFKGVDIEDVIIW